MNPVILSFLLLTAVLKSADCQVRCTDKLSDAALELTRQLVDYDPGYFTITYPNGDIPADKRD